MRSLDGRRALPSSYSAPVVYEGDGALGGVGGRVLDRLGEATVALAVASPAVALAVVLAVRAALG